MPENVFDPMLTQLKLGVYKQPKQNGLYWARSRWSYKGQSGYRYDLVILEYGDKNSGEWYCQELGDESSYPADRYEEFYGPLFAPSELVKDDAPAQQDS